MDDGQGSSVWQETTGAVRRAMVEGPQSRPQTGSSRGAVSAELRPADDREFITILTPCLQLVAPVGMGEDDRDIWFEAARLALIDVPADLLRRGAQYALGHADHPSKIVPAIMREIGDALRARRNVGAAEAAIWQGADNSPHAALPAPGGERPTSAEVDAICRMHGVGRYARADAASPHRPATVSATADPSRPCRPPSDADYLRLFGIDPAEERRKAQAMRDAEAA